MGDSDAYVLEYSVPQNSFRPEVYLFSESEIQRFFKECDTYVLRKNAPGRPYVYPALYRFLYCCGARCGEARHLRCEYVHLNEGYLDILQSKGHRDRRLFLSDELISYLIDYDSAVKNCFPEREYFFPGPSGNIISVSSVPFNFRKIWLAAGLKRDGKIKPRPYDFRHHFACANIARWSKEGKDIMTMLPYLMRYMGHSSLEKTYYYVHLIDYGVPTGLGDFAAVLHRDGIPGDASPAGGAGVAGDGVVKLPRLLPVHVGQCQRPSAVCDGLGDQRGVGIGQVGVSAGGRYPPTVVFIASGLHGDFGIVGLQDAGVAVLGGDLTLRLQHLDNLGHILGAAVQGDNLDVVLGVRLAQVVLQNVQQRVVTALPVKVPGGDGGGIVTGGEVVNLFQPDHAVFLARPYLCGV